MLIVASLARFASFFYYEELAKLPNFEEYSISNISQIAGCIIFFTLSRLALKDNWTRIKMDRLSIIFCFYLLSTTFGVSYIVSIHNTKNTLAVFLIGIMFVCIFFAHDLKKVTALSVFVIILFLSAMITPGLTVQEKFLSVITSIILAFVLYTCSRYSYFYKSEHFVQVKQLEEKNEEINILNHQKGEILAFVAHDLRTPLNNIEALSAMVMEEEKDKPKIEMQMILNATVHAKNIINDLIEVSQEHKTPLKVQNTDITKYLNTITHKWLANSVENKRIEFLSGTKPIFAGINEPKFTRVMDNLIGNALKFSPHESPVQILASSEEELCIIQIKDFGIGIPRDLQHMLFDQFSKAGRPGLRGEKSLGLGLHISKNIITDHCGDLQVCSEENKGTTFTISLPLITVNAPQTSKIIIQQQEQSSLS
ncbi:MAG TPA: HAMP domain-containing sensor histidine kinase [Pedobacter sp.]|nr:HAMP domain-containing sensor histidine kinase [Pedobacter sp.]